MNMIYNSEQYSIVEFGVDHNLEALRFGGYEIVDKSGRREAFIGGKLAQSFRRDVNNLIASEPTMEEIDEFLGSYDSLMSQPVLLHSAEWAEGSAGSLPCKAGPLRRGAVHRANS